MRHAWCNFLLVTSHVGLEEKPRKQDEQENEVEDLNVEKVAKVAAGKHRDYTLGDNYDKLDQLDYRNERFDVIEHGVDFFAFERADVVVSAKQPQLESPFAYSMLSGGTYVYMKMCTVEFSVPMKTAISSAGEGD